MFHTCIWVFNTWLACPGHLRFVPVSNHVLIILDTSDSVSGMLAMPQGPLPHIGVNNHVNKNSHVLIIRCTKNPGVRTYSNGVIRRINSLLVVLCLLIVGCWMSVVG